VGERADADEVDSGFGVGADVGENDAAGGFGGDPLRGTVLGVGSVCFLADAFDGSLDLLGGHVVEENGFGTVGECLLELVRGAHLDLNALAFSAVLKGAGEDGGQAAAEGDVVVLDEDAGGEIDAVVGASAALDRVLIEDAEAGDGFTGVEDAGVGTLNGVDVMAGKGGDTAEVLHKVEDDALATEQDAGVVANDGERLAGMGADAVEHFGVADDFEARLCGGPGVETGEDFKEARDGSQAGDDHFLAGEDVGRGAQVGVDDEVGGGVAGGLVFNQGLLQQCVDAMAFPIHRAENSG